MGSAYRKLFLALSINTVLMLFITFAMISDLAHLKLNLNRLYMALLMAAPMGIVMLLAMRAMFENSKLNLLLFGVFTAVMVAMFTFMRAQTGIGDEQFLRSMIPHHSSAILMCEEADITDPQIIRLCEKIIASQKAEIDEMEMMLSR